MTTTVTVNLHDVEVEVEEDEVMDSLDCSELCDYISNRFDKDDIVKALGITATDLVESCDLTDLVKFSSFGSDEWLDAIAAVRKEPGIATRSSAEEILDWVVNNLNPRLIVEALSVEKAMGAVGVLATETEKRAIAGMFAEEAKGEVTFMNENRDGIEYQRVMLGALPVGAMFGNIVVFGSNRYVCEDSAKAVELARVIALGLDRMRMIP